MRTSKKETVMLLLLNIVWAVVIFVLCTLPPKGLPRLRIPHIDKIAHFGFFFVQSVLLSLLFRFQTRRSYCTIIIMSTLLIFLYGGLIEILQGEFFNRSNDKYDLLADIVGGFVGAIIYPTILRLFNMFFQKV